MNLLEFFWIFWSSTESFGVLLNIGLFWKVGLLGGKLLSLAFFLKQSLDEDTHLPLWLQGMLN